MRIIIILFISLLIIIFKFVSSRQLETLRDMAEQTFLYEKAAQNWQRAHAGMYKDLAKNVYVTFDRFYSSNPESVYFPKSIEEIQKIIRDNQNKIVRTSGGHHTFNDISLSDDVIIRTFNLKRLLAVDKDKKQVTIETGITLEELCMLLEEYDLGLHVLPAIPYQSIGGCIATATHGSFMGAGTLSDAVRDVTVVLSNGDIRQIKFDDQEFPAYATNLGCLGVIYSITLQCVDLYAMQHIRKETVWEKVKDHIPELIKENPYVQIYIWPYTPNLQVTLYNRQKLDTSPTELESLKGVGYTQNVKTVKEAKGIYYRILTRNEEAGHYTESEVGVPFESVVDAADDVIRLFQTHKKFYNYDTEKPLLIRFTGPDYNSWMSMAAGRATAWLDVYKEAPYDDPDQHLKFFKDFENLLIYKYTGRPHWGKRNFMNQYKTQLVYGLLVDYFNKVRNYNDPEKMFSNAFINRVLGE